MKIIVIKNLLLQFSNEMIKDSVLSTLLNLGLWWYFAVSYIWYVFLYELKDSSSVLSRTKGYLMRLLKLCFNSSSILAAECIVFRRESIVVGRDCCL